MGKNEVIRVSSEVESATAQGRPCVALESTVISHGLPRPLNLDVARSLQQIVSSGGAVPVTTAIIDGQLRAGLNDDELELIARSNQVKKVSSRDLPIAIAQRWNGATTVASTIWMAHRIGIYVFATGGIGGVHRGSLPDISADLPELARTPIVVVCSGAKIVLDLPATREWLETHGITVVGYQCDELPAFYSRASGLEVDARAESPSEVARIVVAQRSLGLCSALLVTVPVPNEAEVPHEVLQHILEAALSESNRRGISGHELTPYLLRRMAELSDGATLRANVALLENNARVAAEIACELSKVKS